MSSVAFLPMYAVRGARGHADVLWKCLRDSLRRTGIEAPEQVSDFAPRLEGWLHPGLIPGQTCGLPYIARLSDSVEVCPAGFYRSARVASSADRRQHLSEFFCCTFAINGKDSQSGYGAMMRAAAPFARGGRFFGRAVHTGSHETSMRLVGARLGDIAATASVTWRISRQFDPVISGLKSIGTTEPTPGLPFIAAKGKWDRRLSDAVRAGVAALPEDTRQAFGLRDVLPFRKVDYAVIGSNLAAAEAVHRLPELEEIP